MGCASSKEAEDEIKKESEETKSPNELPVKPKLDHLQSTPIMSNKPPDASKVKRINSTPLPNGTSFNELSLTISNFPEEFVELHPFKFKELHKATQGFNEDLVLGEGGFGKVYKGWLKTANGQLQIAVKKLNADSVQGQQEWLAEILTLGKLQHPNLVKLYGYCTEQGEGLLVYEFLALGSLDYHLFPAVDDEAEVDTLPFEARLKIALGAAKGLAYLHENNVIHRDFKSPNVLLDKSYNARLTDFGLAKVVDTNATHASTRVMGTMGYLDPHFLETGQLNRKSDVYAFGVLLLELLTGKKAMDQNGVPLTAWVQPYLLQRKPDVLAFVDPNLKDYFSTKASQKMALRLVISAKHCIEVDPNLRPLMIDMVNTLMPYVAEADGGSMSVNTDT